MCPMALYFSKATNLALMSPSCQIKKKSRVSYKIHSMHKGKRQLLKRSQLCLLSRPERNASSGLYKDTIWYTGFLVVTQILLLCFSMFLAELTDINLPLGELQVFKSLTLVTLLSMFPAKTTEGQIARVFSTIASILSQKQIYINSNSIKPLIKGWGIKVDNFHSSIAVLFAEDGICKCRPISLFLQNIGFFTPWNSRLNLGNIFLLDKWNWLL